MISLLNANALHIPIKDKSIQCCVTSPPYWGLRDYGVSNQLGLEQTPEEYVENMVTVFREVWRVLRDDGVLWLNLGDSYASGNKAGGRNDTDKMYPGSPEGLRAVSSFKTNHGLKAKDLVGIPWRVAFALQADGWYLRNDIIWHKPNPMPESVKDRCTKSHEYIFLLTKNKKYYYDADAVKEPVKDSTIQRYNYLNDGGNQKLSYGDSKFVNRINPIIEKDGHKEKLIESGRNKRTVWTITTKLYKGAHYATFPPELPEICIKAGSAEGDVILDPFIGSGTTCMVARDLGRQAVGLDLSFNYLVDNAKKRLEIDKLEYWTNGGKEVQSNIDGLPMFEERL